MRSLFLITACLSSAAAFQLRATPLVRAAAAGPSIGRAPCPVADLEKQTDDAARAETLDYFTTLGGFAAFSVGLFAALTAGAGLEDVLAGNIVLVTLCAYGAYLLFFDGGVTQAALENQAVAQLAMEEGDIMDAAPRADVGAFAAAAAAADPSGAARSLADDGFARVDGALSAASASALLAHVNAELEAKRAAAVDDIAAESKSFGDVLMRSQRYDLKLDLDAPVRAALDEALTSLSPLLAASLGADAELFELAALVSDPRSPRQPAHPDTPFREGDGAAVVTAFVALQPVSAEMGPTLFIPKTHTADAHAKFNSPDDGGRARVALLREAPNHVGVLGSGDANLLDSRLLHCGGPNESKRRRVLFYFSFRRKGARTPSGTLAYDLRRAGHTLANADEWAAA